VRLLLYVDIDANEISILRLSTASGAVVAVGEEATSQPPRRNQNKSTSQFTFWPSFAASKSAIQNTL